MINFFTVLCTQTRANNIMISSVYYIDIYILVSGQIDILKVKIERFLKLVPICVIHTYEVIIEKYKKS